MDYEPRHDYDEVDDVGLDLPQGFLSARDKIEDRLADMPSADHGGGWFGWHRAPEVISPVVDVPIFGPGLLDD